METFPYEQLGPVRFQRLCQALIVQQFPNTQCMPLRGPDGGRDSITRTENSDSLIWQMKYREPKPLSDPSSKDLFRWLEKTTLSEIPKVRALKKSGAKSYILITNIPATGHSNTGLRDTFQHWLDDKMPVPTTAWWRDDLDTRLANNYDLIFRFSLFSGVDAVRACLGALYSGISPPSSISESTMRALMAYVAKQYGDDSILKFKQAGISEGKLVDFFVDASLVPENLGQYPLFREFYNRETFETPVIHPASRGTGRSQGAASLLLNPDLPLDTNRFIIEGAPGQGKSTLVQYLCQVHRLKILEKNDEIKVLPSRHSGTDTRFPFKVELRKYAAEFKYSDPKEEDLQGPSLEEYISTSVSKESGGHPFTVADLAETLARIPNLIALDGLDEVASYDVRNIVTTQIREFSLRLGGLKADTLMIITSRPMGVIAGTPADSLNFETLGLQNLDSELIQQYIDAWVQQKGLNRENAEELNEVIASALKEPHVQDLARNAMQLTILIYLVWTKGRSLPSKRTAMYEEYLSIFLDREAEKSPSVRDNRDVLLELHGVLGWLLHCRSELITFASTGDITTEELIHITREYLAAEGRDPDLAEHLYTGVERFFVLVSRTGGTFEFEVQPLREFFAARHLYKTAPHSMGFDVKGTRPDRLEALLRRPYWFNVLRFFAGWYDKGELADLARKLAEVCQSGEYANLSYPRTLIHTLLRDNAFSASIRDAKELGVISTDDIGLATLIIEASAKNNYVGCGLDRHQVAQSPVLGPFLKIAISKLSEPLPDEVVYSFGRPIAHFVNTEERASWFIDESQRRTASWDDWFKRGLITHCLQELPLQDLQLILADRNLSQLDIVRLVEANRVDLFESRPEIQAEALSVIKLGMRTYAPDDTCFSAALEVLQEDFWTKPFQRAAPKNWEALGAPLPAWASSLDALLSGIGSVDWASMSLDCKFGSDLIHNSLGTSWAAWRLALVAASATPRIDRLEATLLPLPSDLAVVWRQGLERGDYLEIEEFLSPSRPLAERLAAAIAVLSWGNLDTLRRTVPIIDSWWSTLPAFLVADARKRLLSVADCRRPKAKLPDTYSAANLISTGFTFASLGLFLANRTRGKQVALVEYCGALTTPKHHDPVVSAEFMKYELQKITRGLVTRDTLERVKDLHLLARGDTTILPNTNQYRLSKHQRRLSPLGQSVLQNPLLFPPPLWQAIDRAALAAVSQDLSPLGAVADKEGWFQDRRGSWSADVRSRGL